MSFFFSKRGFHRVSVHCVAAAEVEQPAARGNMADRPASDPRPPPPPPAVRAARSPPPSPRPRPAPSARSRELRDESRTSRVAPLLRRRRRRAGKLWQQTARQEDGLSLFGPELLDSRRMDCGRPAAIVCRRHGRFDTRCYGMEVKVSSEIRHFSKKEFKL